MPEKENAEESWKGTKRKKREIEKESGGDKKGDKKKEEEEGEEVEMREGMEKQSGGLWEPQQ